jgi:hypothetical protein
MGDTPSDEMIDIQIEESLVRETLMTIDSANYREDVLTLAGFFAILVLTALTGIFGPPSVAIQTIDREITNHSSVERIAFASAPLSGLNRFISLTLKFIEAEPCASSQMRPAFVYRIEARRDGVVMHSEQQKFDSVLLPFRKCSASMQLFTDRLIGYDTVEVSLQMGDLKGEIVKLVIESATGVPDHSLFQIYFRVVFALFALLFLFCLAMRLRSMPVKLWHLEQKLTIPLLVLDFLFTDPLYIVHFYYPSRNLIILHTVLVALFTSYFRFFVLVLFDSLRFKNRKTTNCFFAPKILFVLCTFVVSVIHGVGDDVASLGDSPLERVHSEGASERVETMFYFFYLFWVAGSVLAASAQVDVTERYKFNMYLSAVAFSLLALGVVQLIFYRLRLFGRSSLHFAISFAVQNIFVLLMAYCHWPYEMLQDQTYMDNGDTSEHAPVEFLAGIEGSDKSAEFLGQDSELARITGPRRTPS